ncbi:MlaC/ttg2D family ABC transporter substrate-binding protein [Candidatus Paracaedibacter symbiosus]|uniref:MlaC/ttg2D family ABC transporter substrate-binding protein n=1 Tax=Candidatus Paracaedibacter symbiosus TaxID=244582 RepID=UPI000691BDD8|nr:ABC transporter substrate-binding protein [Candidatus Paracaedibacter symbiosus]
MKILHKLIKAPFLVVCAFFALSVPASAVKGNAEQFINDFGHRAIRSLTTEAPVDSTFLKLLDEGFDLDYISRFVIGRYWKQFSPAQQAEFKEIFRQRLKDTYARRFKEYKGVVLTIKSSHLKEKNEIVETIIQKPGGPATPVDWEVTNGNKIRDVIVEGVSMSQTMRSDYYAAYQNVGATPESFLKSLK